MSRRNHNRLPKQNPDDKLPSINSKEEIEEAKRSIKQYCALHDMFTDEISLSKWMHDERENAKQKHLAEKRQQYVAKKSSTNIQTKPMTDTNKIDDISEQKKIDSVEKIVDVPESWETFD
jgi:hypothetical protein